MERYDLFLTPAMEVVAFPHGTTGPTSVEGQPIGEHFDDWCHFCYPANLTGAPAISVPDGYRRARAAGRAAADRPAAR